VRNCAAPEFPSNQPFEKKSLQFKNGVYEKPSSIFGLSVQPMPSTRHFPRPDIPESSVLRSISGDNCDLIQEDDVHGHVEQDDMRANPSQKSAKSRGLHEDIADILLSIADIKKPRLEERERNNTTPVLYKLPCSYDGTSQQVASSNFYLRPDGGILFSSIPAESKEKKADAGPQERISFLRLNPNSRVVQVLGVK